MNSNLKEKYFEWLYDEVMTPKMKELMDYHKLLRYLHSRDFTYTIPRDGNRCADGIDLRYRFGMEKKTDDRIIAAELDNRPCSILEMMVALCLRIEEQIMSNHIAGNRTFKWFWEMLSNMGLAQMQDPSFDENLVELICNRFLDRSYDQNGKGGLFTVYHRNEDMREVEIWYQAMWYLTELDGI